MAISRDGSLWGIFVMSNKTYHIAIIGDDLQAYVACSYLSNELRASNIRLTPIILPPKADSTIKHVFTPFTQMLSPILASRGDTVSQGFESIAIKTKNMPDGLAFNFSDYGEVSAAVNFHQAYEVCKKHNNNTPPISAFLTRNKKTFGVTYNKESAKEIFRHECIKRDIYTIRTEGLSVTLNNGSIEKITTTEGQVIKADLYIDCSKHQCIMSQLQEPTKIPANNIPHYQVENKTTENSAPAGSIIFSDENSISCELNTGKTSEHRRYVFSDEHTRGSTRGMYFDRPWLNNCVSLGRGYCELPELLICMDRILESQLLVLALFLPISSGLSSAQKHYAMHSQRILSDAIDSANLLISEILPSCELTNSNSLRKQLFESSAASHQSEQSMINNSCWGALMRSIDIKPKTTNALAQARPASEISKKVTQLLTGE